jgi:hypothetical protein
VTRVPDVPAIAVGVDLFGDHLHAVACPDGGRVLIPGSPIGAAQQYDLVLEDG